MKKTACLFLSVFAIMFGFNAYADDVNTKAIDIDEKLELSIKHFGRFAFLFEEEAWDTFLDNLLKRCKYDTNKNVVIASMTDLGVVCLKTFSNINPNMSAQRIGETYTDTCMDFAMNVAKNALKDSGAGESDGQVMQAQRFTPERMDGVPADDDNIFAVTFSSNNERAARNGFERGLKSFVARKYCTGQASISCYPSPTLQCNRKSNVTDLNLDLELKIACQRKYWQLTEINVDGDIQYEYRLKQ